MNDLPQNELLSAYLDGELTAAEQAEVERLLAANPAARQLLDELRTLSATLQALPQQKLGEDLSQRVLRVAERRMLTGEEPGQTEPSPLAPVPLVRSVFRRVANRRTMVWLGLTVAIAVMITINERRQRAGKEVALAPAVSESAARSPGPPPSIRAADEESPAAAEVLKSPAETKSPVDNYRRLDRAKAKGAEQPAATTTAAAPPAGAPVAGPAAGFGAVRFGGKPATEDNKEPVVARDAEPAVASSRPAANVPAEAAPTAPLSGTAKSGKEPAKDGPARRAEEAEKLAELDEGLLVVYCNISPEAAQKRAFDKLLDANGITWRQRRDRSAPVDDSKITDPKVTKADERGEKAVDGLRQKLAIDESLLWKSLAGEAGLIYAEGTAAQISAAFAGLRAQPDVFLSVSVKPTLDGAAPYGLLKEADRQPERGGEAEGKPGFTGMGRGVVRAKTLFQSPARAAKIEAAAGKDGATLNSKENGQVGVAATGPASQPLAQSPSRQRVLFVLRVVGAEQPPAAAAKVQQGRVNAEAATPAEPTMPPADRPTPEK